MTQRTPPAIPLPTGNGSGRAGAIRFRVGAQTDTIFSLSEAA